MINDKTLTFAELKRTLIVGKQFKVIKHYVRPELDGEIRTVNKVQTNAIYSTNGENDRLNGGLGRRTDWGVRLKIGNLILTAQ